MKGKRLSFDGLSLFCTENDSGNFRVGISVGKKLANAVRRNRLKRQIRASAMKVLKDHAGGYDLVFVARGKLATADYAQILTAVGTVIRRSGVCIHRIEGT